MGSDMMVAVGPATVAGSTLFGHNLTRGIGAFQPLHQSVGRAYAHGERLQTQTLEIDQALQTYCVIGVQPKGCWGYECGVNERAVAAGCLDYPGKLTAGAQPGLTGPDLVRLVLERAGGARKGVDLLCEWIATHGLAEPGNLLFLVADADEAFHVASAGAHWGLQEIHQVRAASNACTIHQDWDRLAPGLSEHAIEQGWWPGDGSKLDFGAAVSQETVDIESALRRWGRATYLLEQQNGKIDPPLLRRILGDHYEATPHEVDPRARSALTPICRHAVGADQQATLLSLTALLTCTEQAAPLIGCAFGPPCLSLYFPLFIDGPLPEAFTTDGLFAQRLHFLYQHLQQEPERWRDLQFQRGELQEQFDVEARALALSAVELRRDEDPRAHERQLGSFMQSCVERFEAMLTSTAPRRLTPVHI